MKTSEISKLSLLLGSAFLTTTTALQASTDFGPAIYRPMSGCTKWYTSGSGHHFCVIHDMEGYYASTISYLNNCNVSVSIHYMANGKQDTSTDYPAGEIDQQVREADYAWHARCWNTWMYGTEHEGFASNPAWYTTIMYADSATLQRHLALVSSIPKDRNHIIGHNEHNNANWRNWMAANYPSINSTCNTHSDPGPYWDWSKFMGYLAGTETSAQHSQSPTDGTSFLPGATFTYSITVTNTGGTPWICLGGTQGYTLNYYSGTQMGWTQHTLGTDTVYPAEAHTFSQTLTAPSTPGTYTLYTRMNNADDNYYGGTFGLTINVSGTKITNIVDNVDAGFSVFGTWATGTSSTDKYGADYRWASTDTNNTDTATWTSNLSNTGTYKVYAWWTQGSNRTTGAKYQVNGGTAVFKNQTSSGGVWNLIGTYSLSAGNNSVVVTAVGDTGDVCVADAVKFEQQ